MERLRKTIIFVGTVIILLTMFFLLLGSARFMFEQEGQHQLDKINLDSLSLDKFKSEV